YPLPRLLFYLYRKQFTGRLHVGPAEEPNAVYFHQGIPVMAQIAEQVESIGQLLVRMRVIDEALYHQALMQRRQTGTDEREILKALGRAPDEQIDHAARQLVLKKISRLFRMEDAPFSIYREEHAFIPTPESAERVRLHPRRVIYHGIRNAYNPDRVATELGE